jgi:hypothetical protein
MYLVHSSGIGREAMTHEVYRLLACSVILLFIVTACSNRQKRGATAPPVPETSASQQEPQRQRREVNRPKRIRQKAQTVRKAPVERKTSTKKQPSPEQEEVTEQQPLPEWGEK